MMYAYEVLTHLRGRLRDIPYKAVLTTALNATDDTTVITVGTSHINRFRIGGTVELVPASGGVAIGTNIPEEAMVMSIDATGGTITVKRGYNGSTKLSASSGSTLGYWVMSFDFFSTKFLVSSYNETVKKIFPKVYRKAVRVYDPARDVLTEYDSAAWWKFVFPTEALVYEVKGVGTTDAGDLQPINKWEVVEDMDALTSTYLFLFEFAMHDGFGYEPGSSAWGGKTIIMPGVKLTTYPSFHARLVAPLPQMFYAGYLYNNMQTNALGMMMPLLPTAYLRLISLGVELICMEDMLIDREKYDRYTTSAWNQAVTPYEISNAITNLQTMFNRELDDMTMPIPRVRRRMNS